MARNSPPPGSVPAADRLEALPLTDLFERLPIGAYRTSVDGRQLRANRALVLLNGYDTEQQLLQAVNNIADEWYVEPTRRTEFIGVIERDGQVVNFESEIYRHRTRERIWIRENAYALRDDAGRVLGYEGTVEDITAVRQAQQALQHSERRFRALTEKAQVMTLVCDAAGVVLYASPASRSLLGLEPAAVVGQCSFDWIHADDVERCRREFAEVVEARNPGVESHYRLRHADGSWRVLASLGTNCLDDPAVQGLVLNWRDVTDSARAAQALALSEHKFKTAFAVSPDALIISRLADGTYLEVNDTFCQLSGYSRAELIGRSAVDLHIWASAADRAAFVAAFSRAGRVRDFEAPYRGKGDHQGVVSISAEVVDIDGVTCLLSISRDITRRLAVQRALAESEARLRLALESANQGLYDVDLVTGEAIVSPEYARMLGHEPEAFHETHAGWLERLHPDDARRVGETFDDYVAGRVPAYEVEFRQRTNRGEWKWILSRGRIAEPALPGQHRRILGTHTDIDARKQLESAQGRQLQRLRAAESQAGLGSWDYDFGRRQGWWSDQMYTLFGLDAAAGMPSLETFFGCLHPDDRAVASETLQREVDGGRLAPSLFRTDPARGPLRWLSVSVQPETAAAGNLRYSGTVLDITAMRQAQRAIEDSEARYRTLVSQSPYAICLHQDGRILYVNPAAVSLFAARDKELLIGQPVFDRCHPDERAEAQRRIGRVAEGRRDVQRFETRCLRLDGRVIEVEASSTRVTQAGQPAIQTLLVDIGARKLQERERAQLLADAEAARRLADAARAQLDSVFERVDDGVVALDKDWRYTYVNSNAARMLQRQGPQDLLGRHIWTEYPDRVGQPFQAAYERAASTQQPVTFEQHDEPRGQWFENRIYPSADGLTIYFTEITQRKRAEVALASQLSRLERAEGIANMGSWEQDLATGTVWWSAQMFAMTQLPPEGGAPADLRHLHAADRALARAAMDRAIATGAQQQVTVRSNPELGPPRWYGATGRPEVDAQGRPLRLTGTLIDVTALVQAEQALRELNSELEARVSERTAQLAESERRYRIVFESVPVAILRQDWSVATATVRALQHLDADALRAHLAARPQLLAHCLRSTRIESMNPAAMALYGVTAQPQQMASLEDVFKQTGATEGFVDELLALHAGLARFTATRTITRADGSRRDGLVNVAFASPDSSDGVALVSITDVTELQRLTAALDDSLQRVQRANRELETFTYSVSHDLKAPLRGLDGYSQLLLRDHAGALDAEARGFLAHIRRASVQMGQLIDDLLTYSRIERRPQELVSLSLASIVRPVLAACAAELAQRGMVAELDLPPEPVRADEQGLTQTLRNLVDNALKFTLRTPQARLAIGGHATATTVVLWVRDNGLGFDMKFHDRIFEIFQRLQRGEDYPGTGVGLAIVHKAMERMGGRAWAESAPGQGATFFLELPRA